MPYKVISSIAQHVLLHQRKHLNDKLWYLNIPARLFAQSSIYHKNNNRCKRPGCSHRNPLHVKTRHAFETISKNTTLNVDMMSNGHPSRPLPTAHLQLRSRFTAFSPSFVPYKTCASFQTSSLAPSTTLKTPHQHPSTSP